MAPSNVDIEGASSPAFWQLSQWSISWKSTPCTVEDESLINLNAGRQGDTHVVLQQSSTWGAVKLHDLGALTPSFVIKGHVSWVDTGNLNV